MEQLSSRAPRTAQESRANFFMVGAAVGGFMTATMTGEPTDIRRFWGVMGVYHTLTKTKIASKRLAILTKTNIY